VPESGKQQNTLMNKIIITGATGNVGNEVVNSLIKFGQQNRILVGLRDINKGYEWLDSSHKIKFDFQDPETYYEALKPGNILFLLRPPELADVSKYFKPLIEKAKQLGVKHIVFLSVQGADKMSVIPHHKIERLIIKSEIPYTFLRPSYFMQNFTTILLADLKNKRTIFLPAGNTKFSLVDVRDIGEVAARVIMDPEDHKNKAYELTSGENIGFKEVAEKLSLHLKRPFTYISANLLQFYLTKRKEGMKRAMILVMTLLHFLPRFQKEPRITDCIKAITGRLPYTFDQFIEDHKNVFNN
jgi:uncharacterized protein YbjT (DUF2867 family)